MSRRKGVGGQLLHVALCPLSVPSRRKTDMSRREREGWVANCYMWPSTLFLSLLKGRQTCLGERERVGGQLLHVALYPLPVPSKRKTDMSSREREGWVANSYMWPSAPLLFILEERQTCLGERERERGGWPAPTCG